MKLLRRDRAMRLPNRTTRLRDVDDPGSVQLADEQREFRLAESLKPTRPPQLFDYFPPRNIATVFELSRSERYSRGTMSSVGTMLTETSKIHSCDHCSDLETPRMSELSTPSRGACEPISNSFEDRGSTGAVARANFQED